MVDAEYIVLIEYIQISDVINDIRIINLEFTSKRESYCKFYA